MPPLRTKELRELLDGVNSRLKALEAGLPDGMTLEAVVAAAHSNLEKTKQSSTEIDSIAETLRARKLEADHIKGEINALGVDLKAYKEILYVDRDDFIKFRESFAETQEKTKFLQQETERQLGLVNAETLANSFNDEAEKLKISTDEWFIKIQWMSGVFAIAVVCIAIWQTLASEIIFELSFLIRAIIIAPIIWFLYFCSRNYREEKNLLDSYLFKAATARSFEAYRQLLRSQFKDYPEIFDSSGVQKISLAQTEEIKFITSTVSSIYQPPFLKINNEKLTKNDSDSLEDLFLVMERIKGLFH